MIIDLKTLAKGPRRFSSTLEPDWWKGHDADRQLLGLDGPLSYDINLYKAGGKYVLEGRLSGGLIVQCDRCLEPFHRDLKTEFRLFLALSRPDGDEADVELVREDLFVDFITGEELELEEVIREQIYLALPMKSLCKVDCLGLCPVCGVDLNIEQCGCERRSGHPGFAKLKALKVR